MLRRQALLLEMTPVLLSDPENRILYWNRAAEVMYGFTGEQALGKLSHELLATQFPEPLERILERLRAGGPWQGEVCHVRSDGKKINVATEWIALLDERGVLEAIIQVNTEITGRKQAEAALVGTTARFDAIITSAMDAIISVDARQQIVLFNPAAEQMFGLESKAALGQSLDRFIPERFRKAHRRHVEEFGETGASSRRMGALGTISGVRANGEEFPIEASISHVEVEGEQLFTVILRDITQRERDEEALRQAQAELAAHAENLEHIVARRTAQLRESIAELEAFSYSLSHDLRAPLRAINSFTQIFLEDYGATLTPDGKELLSRAQAAAGRMERLMQDVLAFSRVVRQPIELKPVDLEKLVLDIVVERPELQAADIRLEGPLLPMLGHEASVIQCLTNLLSNAVKFVEKGVKPRVRLSTERVGNNVRLWVTDNGIGIPPEAQRKVFEIFQRLSSNYEGSGIGLAIVKKAIDRMGGRAGVDSEPGKGSRFWIELKAADTAEAPPTNPAAAA